MTTKNERHQAALQILKDAHRIYGEHPNRKEEHYINDALMPWIGWPASPAQITEALAIIATIDLRRKNRPCLVRNTQDMQPGDTLYKDTLADYEANDERTLYAIIQEIENNGKD